MSGFFEPGGASQGIVLLALSIVIGLALGSIRIGDVRLGVSAVLFSALAFGQFGLTLNPALLPFVTNFSLATFVYAIGLQVGPGFVTSLKATGLRLNLLAAGTVVLGAVMSALIARFAPVPHHAAAGIFCGAFTSTPGLGAAQDTLSSILGKGTPQAQAAIGKAALAYTCGYPFGLVGPIVIILGLSKLFGVRLADEAQALAAEEAQRRPPVSTVDIEVLNEPWLNKPLSHLQSLRQRGILLSRRWRDGVVSAPNGQTELASGDIVRAVGPSTALKELTVEMGRPSTVDLASASGDVDRMELVVTHRQVVGRTLAELNLIRRLGVTVARVHRAGIELRPHASLALHFGDNVLAVGPKAQLAIAEEELGNSADVLNRPLLVPIFLGLVLGVIAGNIPIHIPGLQAPIRIGLAGGPMLVAIILSRLGNIGAVIWYMPAASNQLLRDFGMSVFLACIGMQAGDHFLQNLANGGIPLLFWGAVVTLVPMTLIALIARLVMKMNFITLSGLIAGSMTNSSTLLFAGELTESSVPAVVYAAVYPACMILPIFAAQILASVVR